MQRIPTCHPDKQHGALGLCRSCYNKHLRQINPAYRLSCQKSGERHRAAHPERKLATTLRQRYGLTIAQYEAMKASQQNKCFICRETKPLVIDHNHATGKVRGLLCCRCNTLCGFLEKSWSLVPAAILYTKFEVNHLGQDDRYKAPPVS